MTRGDATAPAISIACLDMAGTTIVDDGAVVAAFTVAIEAAGLDPAGDQGRAALEYVRDTMGRSKIEVFRAVLDGDEERSRTANAAFEQAYGDHVRAHGAAAIPGAADAMGRLREHGLRVCLTTGFAPATRDLLIDALDWRDVIDLALSPADIGGRGRPWPDLPLHALLRLAGEDVRALAVAGDTADDLWSGHRAGAAIVAGVLTGAHDEDTLAAAPHTHIVESVAALPELLLATRQAAA
jgi:phosphoglycolate phosphatase